MIWLYSKLSSNKEYKTFFPFVKHNFDMVDTVNYILFSSIRTQYIDIDKSRFICYLLIQLCAAKSARTSSLPINTILTNRYVSGQNVSICARFIMEEIGAVRIRSILNVVARRHSGEKIAIDTANNGGKNIRIIYRNTRAATASNAGNICGNICADTGQFVGKGDNLVNRNKS